MTTLYWEIVEELSRDQSVVASQVKPFWAPAAGNHSLASLVKSMCAASQVPL